MPGDPRLRPDWVQGSSQWPDEVPGDLRLRLLDAVSFGSYGIDDLWDEVRSLSLIHI